MARNYNNTCKVLFTTENGNPRFEEIYEIELIEK